VTVERIVIKVHLGIERIHLGSGDEERIDLGERGIRIFEGAVEGHHELRGINDKPEAGPDRTRAAAWKG
jgi:hypothetical protein